MDVKQKRRFVEELIANVQSDIMENIEMTPDTWDGIELRQYIADMFASCIFKNTMTSSRKREYKNTCLTLGI